MTLQMSSFKQLPVKMDGISRRLIELLIKKGTLNYSRKGWEDLKLSPGDESV